MLRPLHLVLTCCLLACSTKEERPAEAQTAEPVVLQESREQISWLSRYDLSAKPPKQFRLAKKLSEISGLAMTDDGRLICHDDESAMVYQLDYATGSIVKQFVFGSGFLEEDFEGIALKGDTMYVASSGGDIFEFPEVADKGRSSFRLFKTALSQKNDVEGLEYDPETDCLLVACKADAGEHFRGYKAIYAFSLKTKTLLEKPRFLIPLKEVKKESARGDFNPSGIARHPVSGTIFIVTADGESIIEIDRAGRVLGQEKLPKRTNSQPEGIAFAPDLSLIICNDGQGGTGTLSVYPVVR